MPMRRAANALALRLAALLALALASGLSPAGAQAAALRVAVLDFENASADRNLDPWGKGLQSMFITDLSEVSALQLVERARLVDVQRELKLGRSRAIDPSTAARLGKLLGASHLVAGTFTVAGKKLRMDLRLFSVESGAVLLSEKSEGETEAFFEVQKALVKRVVEAVSIRVEPKERAALMRAQTADLAAFNAFSSGLSLFDDRRYEEALEAIKEARRHDQDFKLAEITQAEYERVVAELRAEAVALSAREQAPARKAAREEARVEAAALKRLYDIAERKGDAAREERLVALGALASWLAGPRPQPSAPPAVPES
jgi:TolB-like protein